MTTEYKKIDYWMVQTRSGDIVLAFNRGERFVDVNDGAFLPDAIKLFKIEEKQTKLIDKAREID